jgi:hypothetical protein
VVPLARPRLIFGSVGARLRCSAAFAG